MPVFHVRTDANVTKEFIVKAGSREEAQELVYEEVMENGSTANKNVRQLRTDATDAISISDADETAWTEATKKKKAK